MLDSHNTLNRVILYNTDKTDVTPTLFLNFFEIFLEPYSFGSLQS